MNLSVLALAALTLSACVTTPKERVWTVRQVMDNHQSLDGKTIAVRGWVDGCQRLSCVLYDSAEEAKKESANYWLSIGSDPSFDQAAARHIPSYVVMEARVETQCMNDPGSGTLALCGDRSDTLLPLRIVRWAE